MRHIFLALKRALHSLTQPGIFVHLLWPGAAAALVWGVVAWWAGGALIDSLVGGFKGLPVVGAALENLPLLAEGAHFLVKVSVMLGFVAVFYLTTTLLISLVALPLMLERVGERDYPNLEQRHGGTNFGSVANTLRACMGYVLILVVSLFFWFIPGVSLIASFIATAWLNQRVYGYDALMRHADADELPRLREKKRSSMLALGGITALLVYVPLLNVVAPAFTGLAFVHYLLNALKRERRHL